jgi:putative sugar O-methyltransferase
MAAEGTSVHAIVQTSFYIKITVIFEPPRRNDCLGSLYQRYRRPLLQKLREKMPQTITFDDLVPLAAEVRAFIARNAEKSSKTPAGRTSEFWSDIFQSRTNFPDLNSLLVCRREGNTSGIDTDALASIEAERAYSDQIHHLFRRMVPRDYAASLPESTFGAPYVFEHDGLVRSAAFWLQCGTSQRVLEFVKRFGTNRPLRVLEIGAGMGMCAQHLHAKTDVENYTIVDLPENIYVSSLGLSTILPDRQVELHDVEGEALGSMKPGSMNFCLPGTIGRIEAQFDLVINSFSMQEMAIENVNAYIDWIETALSEDGIFVSLNSHAKAGVKQPGDYRYGKFHIHHWGVFRQTPLAWFNTIPYEVVVGRRRETSPAYSKAAQNAIGWLMQLGLDGDLRSLCGGFVAGKLSSDQSALLGHYENFFGGAGDEERTLALEAAGRLDRSAVLPFVKAHYHLARDEAAAAAGFLEDALRLGLSDFARLRAGVLTSVIARRTGRSIPIRSLEGLDVARGYPNAYELTQNGDIDPLVAHANHVLGRPFSRSLPQRIARKLVRPRGVTG